MTTFARIMRLIGEFILAIAVLVVIWATLAVVFAAFR